MFSQKWISKIKKEYGFLLKPILKFLDDNGVEPNVVTAFSLLFGVLAFYFLFLNHILFVIFGILHLICDIIDGNLARFRNRETKFGYYFDYISDRTVHVLLLIKVAGAVNPFWAMLCWLAVFLLIIHHAMHLFVRKDIVFFSRTATLIILMFGFNILALAVSLVVTILGLLSQLRKK